MGEHELLQALEMTRVVRVGAYKIKEAMIEHLKGFLLDLRSIMPQQRKGIEL